MNCPECQSGILERMGYVFISLDQNGHFVFEHCFQKKGEIQTPIYICSREDCSYLKTEASPGITRLAKQVNKSSVLEHT